MSPTLAFIISGGVTTLIGFVCGIALVLWIDRSNGPRF